MSEFYRIETLSDLFGAIGIPGPKHPLIDFVDFSKTPVKITVPDVKVVCGLYQIGFKNSANGMIKYGRSSYDYKDGSLLYIAPEQVVEYGELDNVRIDENWVLFFHPDLLHAFDLDKKMKDYSFFNYESNEALHLSTKEKEVIESVIANIALELDNNLDDFSEEVIVNNLELVLNYSKRFYNRQFITRKRFSKGPVEKFDELLRGYFEHGVQKDQGLPTIEYFAKQLNYSANYLSDLIKKGTDKSVLEHIHYHVIHLAKRALLNSNKTVSQIAFDLGFEYSQYFSRLFKKKTGLTPIEYRKAS